MIVREFMLYLCFRNIVLQVGLSIQHRRTLLLDKQDSLLQGVLSFLGGGRMSLKVGSALQFSKKMGIMENLLSKMHGKLNPEKIIWLLKVLQKALLYLRKTGHNLLQALLALSQDGHLVLPPPFIFAHPRMAIFTSSEGVAAFVKGYNLSSMSYVLKPSLINITINGMNLRGLLDSGASDCLMTTKLLKWLSLKSTRSLLGKLHWQTES